MEKMEQKDMEPHVIPPPVPGSTIRKIMNLVGPDKQV
jgi:hypothetical protein